MSSSKKDHKLILFNLYTLKEISDILGISISSLRYYKPEGSPF